MALRWLKERVAEHPSALTLVAAGPGSGIEGVLVQSLMVSTRTPMPSEGFTASALLRVDSIICNTRQTWDNRDFC